MHVLHIVLREIVRRTGQERGFDRCHGREAPARAALRLVPDRRQLPQRAQIVAGGISGREDQTGVLHPGEVHRQGNEARRMPVGSDEPDPPPFQFRPVSDKLGVERSQGGSVSNLLGRRQLAQNHSQKKRRGRALQTRHIGPFPVPGFKAPNVPQPRPAGVRGQPLSCSRKLSSRNRNLEPSWSV